MEDTQILLRIFSHMLIVIKLRYILAADIFFFKLVPNIEEGQYIFLWGRGTKWGARGQKCMSKNIPSKQINNGLLNLKFLNIWY